MGERRRRRGFCVAGWPGPIIEISRGFLNESTTRTRTNEQFWNMCLSGCLDDTLRGHERTNNFGICVCLDVWMIHFRGYVPLIKEYVPLKELSPHIFN